MTIIWKDFSSWDGIVRTTITPASVLEVISKMKRAGEGGYVQDDPGWLHPLENHLGYPIKDAINNLANALERENIRVYHGCRPIDISSYLSKGLKVHRRNELISELRKMVMSDTRLSRFDLDGRIGEVKKSYDNGKLFLVFDDRYMIEYAGHYLIYGGEYIANVLRDHLEVLLEKGTPTIITVDLPGRMISRPILEGFAKDLLTEWTRQVINEPKSVHMRDCGVELESDLDPKYIVGHEHPLVIKDPWNSRQEYIVENNCCRTTPQA
ncbi:MAG: hypothetical protein KGI69_00950 [Patescibacteria group bacterium]|nr:hypothetical protein [Patescibacteria group bacterium]